MSRLREGKSYTTRSVRAAQSGKNVFILICSFHKPEPEHPFHQWTKPIDAPDPDTLEMDYDMWARLRREATDERLIRILEQFEQARHSNLASVHALKKGIALS